MQYSKGEAYTVNELAARWNVSTITIYRLLESRTLPGFKVGKSWRISAKTVTAFEELNNQ